MIISLDDELFELTSRSCHYTYQFSVCPTVIKKKYNFLDIWIVDRNERIVVNF